MKVHSIKFNFVMNFILSLSAIIFPLITFRYVSQILLVEGNGKVTFATSVVTYFAMFASLGIPTYGIRACARVRDDRKKLSKTVQELVWVNVVTTLIVTVIFIVSLFVIPKFSQERPLFLITGSILWLNVIGVNWLYSALEQYSYIAVRSLIFKVISVVLMFIFVKRIEDYVVYGAITVFASAGSNVLNFIYLRKFIDFKRSEKYDFKQHMRPIFVFFATSIATSVYTNLDTVMLGFISGNRATGYYSAAIKVKVVLVSLVTSLGTVLLPRLSYYIQQEKQDEFRRVVTKAFNFVLIIATGLVFYFIAFAKDSILLLSQEEFLGAVRPMQLLMPTLLFIGLTNIMGIQILVPIGQEKKVLISLIWGAGINLLLNAVLISRFQASGAAFASLMAELTVLIVQAYYLRDFLKTLWKKLSLRYILVSLAAGMLIVFGMKSFLTFSPFFNLLISAIGFFSVYFGTLLLQKEPLLTGLLEKAIQKFRK